MRWPTCLLFVHPSSSLTSIFLFASVFVLRIVFPRMRLGSLLFLLSSFPKDSLLPKTFSDQQCKTVALPTSPHISISCVIYSLCNIVAFDTLYNLLLLVHLLHWSTCILKAKLFIFYGHCCPLKSRVGLLHSRQSGNICTRN